MAALGVKTNESVCFGVCHMCVCFLSSRFSGQPVESLMSFMIRATCFKIVLHFVCGMISACQQPYVSSEWMSHILLHGWNVSRGHT